MASPKTSPFLADAANLLSGHLYQHLRRLAVFLARRGARLERQFAQRLHRLGFPAAQISALAAVTASAAARLLARRKSLAEFFEQVAYSGRRLAKLDLPPGRALLALGEYDRLLEAEFGRLDAARRAELLAAKEQLHFGVILTLNNAFYQVREAETRAFYDLFQAELEAAGQAELLKRCGDILARFCQAEQGRIRLGEPVPTALRRPRYFKRGASVERLLIEPAWARQYPAFWSIPILSEGRPVGLMQFAFQKPYEWLPRELQLLAAAAERCLRAAEKSRLMEELAAREKLLRQLAAHMLQVEEAERRRISRELHDEAGQLLLCLRLQLEMLERLAPEDAAALRSGLLETRQLAERTIVEVRRVIADLSPALLERLGLAAALRHLAGRLRRLHGMRVHLHTAGLKGLAERTAVVIYRLVQECCSNIARHSAAGTVNISVTSADQGVRLAIDDDGVGLLPREAFAKKGSLGLAGMKERVALLGGEFKLQSRPGQGVRIRIKLPPAKPDPQEPAASNEGGGAVHVQD